MGYFTWEFSNVHFQLVRRRHLLLSSPYASPKYLRTPLLLFSYICIFPQSCSSTLFRPKGTSLTSILFHLSSLYHCFHSLSFSRSICFSRFNISPPSSSKIFEMATMNKIYTSVRGVGGVPEPQPNGSVELFAPIDGHSARVGTSV